MDVGRACQLVRDGKFEELFVEELGWDHFDTGLTVQVGDEATTLQAIAQKRGMVAYLCSTRDGQRLPDYAARRKIEHQVAKAVHEHLIIFTDATKTGQVWQWVKREPGRPTACREHSFHTSQSGQALVQKLQAIAFTLDEEERLTLTDVTRRARSGFDVERVTKRFYDQFKKEHAAFLKLITGITDSGDHEWYASVMLNRLMFVYFIQRKGFLDGDVHYLRNRLLRCQEQAGRDKFYSFYRYFLLRLFHEGLGAGNRTAELDELLGRIPYLNGGLFERHEVEARYPAIQIPDKAFERIFAYFDQYQWHLDERPLRHDYEINPDVLGYIFEKYINQKQMGAYYTKEDITGYISKSTVVPFLLDAARAKCRVAFENPNGPTVWNLLREDPDRYIYPAVRHGVTWDVHTKRPLERPFELPAEIALGLDTSKPDLLDRRREWNRSAPPEYALPTEIWREVVARRARYVDVRGRLVRSEVRDANDLITLNLDIRQFAQDAIGDCEGPDLLRAFWHAIEKVTVLDPTCGSGAFLFAALNILEPLYEGCLERMEAFVEDLDRSGEKHRPEKLSDFRQVLERVKAHPNRRYFIFKSIILNNLFGVDIMDEAVEICKLRLFLKLAAQVEPDTKHPNLGIEPLPDIDFNIKVGNALVGFASHDEVQRAGTAKFDFDNAMEKMSVRVADLQQAFDAFRHRQIEGDGSVPIEDKLELRKRLTAVREEVNGYLAGEYGVAQTKKGAYAKWVKSHQPFDWFVEFYGILSNGGFDVIIGNPPYVEYRSVRDSYRLSRGQYASEAAENLYAFCMERSCRLLQPSGWFGMIVPTAVLGLDETVSLRGVLLKRLSESWCSSYAIRPSKLFDGVDQRLCVYLGTERKGGEPHIWTTRYHHWNAEERTALFPLMTYARSFLHDRLGRIPQLGSPTAVGILQKLEEKRQKTAGRHFASAKRGVLMHYHRSPRYWIRAMDFEQYFKSPTRSRSVHHFRDVYFEDQAHAKVIGALWNSTLFFFWFVSVGNGRNITGTDVEQVPVGEVSEELLKEMPGVFDRLMLDYQRNSLIRERRDCEFQEFRPSMSKTILDDIDRLLARHYGFTDEELDFIVNYDIKYRMGRDTDGEEE